MREPSPKRAASLIIGGWLLLLLAGLPVIVWPDFFFGRFSGAPVRMKEWMWVLSAVLRVAQLMGLGLILWGLRRVEAHGKATHARLIAIGVHGLAAGMVLTGLAAPFFIVAGPWEPFAPEPRLLRHLAFFPAALQGIGLAALVATFRARRPVLVIGAACGLIGASIAIAVWHATPQALMPRPLVGTGHPASALIWIVGFVGLVLGVLPAKTDVE